MITHRHLAGIVCGFCLHWGLAIPPLEVCSSNVLIGGMFLLGLFWRKQIPVRPLLTASLDEEGQVEHEEYLSSLLRANGDGESDGLSSANDPFAQGKQRKRERILNEFRKKRKTLLSLRNLIGVLLLMSLFAFQWTSSLVLSQCLLLSYFTFGTQSSIIVWAYTNDRESLEIIEAEKVRSGAIWRGFFMSAVLSIVLDSMSLAAWCVFPTLIVAEQRSLPLGLLPVTLLIAFRIAVNVVASVVASKILHDTKQVGSGIFVKVFSIPIKLSRALGDHGVFTMQSALFTAFEGRGITLGGDT